MNSTIQSESESLNSGGGCLTSRYSTAVEELFESCSAHQRAVLGVVSLADQHDLELVPMLEGLGTEVTSSYWSCIDQMMSNIEQGQGVVDAMGSVDGLLPPEGNLMLQMADADGAMSQFLAEVARKATMLPTPPTMVHDSETLRIVRLIGRVLVFASISSFLLLYIVPEFMEILEDLDTELPAVMRFWCLMAESLVVFWGVSILVLLTLLILAIVSDGIWSRLWHPANWGQREIPRSVSRRRTLAMAAEANRSLLSGMELISKSVSGNSDTGRMADAVSRVRDDGQPWESIAAARLISSREADSLSIAESGETQAWLLRWAASRQKANDRAPLRWAIRLTVGAVHILLGLMVAMAFISIFRALFVIMESIN